MKDVKDCTAVCVSVLWWWLSSVYDDLWQDAWMSSA